MTKKRIAAGAGEFGGCYSSTGTQLSPADFQAVIAFFESSSWVTSYSFFPIRWSKPGDPPPQGGCPALLDNNGNLTSIGQVYAVYGQEAYPPPPHQQMPEFSYP